MFAVLIATVTTAFVALVVMAFAQRRRAPRTTPPQRHPARGMGAALLVSLISGAGLFAAFSSAQAETVEPRNRWAIVPTAPMVAPPQLETLSVPSD